jgi:hypothetical protein
MRIIGFLLALSLGACLVPSPCRGGFMPSFIIEAPQPFTNPADNFEIVLTGESPSNIVGPFVNAFSNPKPVAIATNPATRSTVIEFAGAPIPTSKSTRFQFGFSLLTGTTSAFGSSVTDIYWTIGNTIEGHLAAPSITIAYPSPQLTTITFTNDPAPGIIELSHVQYARSPLTPGHPQLAPGMSTSFTVSGTGWDRSMTVSTDATFTDPLTGTTTTDTARLMFGAAPTPEPGSLVLALVGSIGLLAGAARMRHRGADRL